MSGFQIGRHPLWIMIQFLVMTQVDNNQIIIFSPLLYTNDLCPPSLYLITKLNTSAYRTLHAEVHAFLTSMLE
jgi:hypothetical protein